ncbi:hypothetical protein QQZ08_008535 [Neonectria magnoliae]|uniref:Fungal STAND N-terminal Goodbye domain-containing protein n=1 Tax=Neonectria magnoliae TaxID=2732573 RepID=A0ABR1HV04_9HYPO
MATSVPLDLAKELESDNRDVADLWKDALKQYKGIVGFDLEQKFGNVEAMIAKGTDEMNNFHKFRHNDKKVDKLRTLFATNLDYLEKGAQQLISAAVPAFPPAAAIGTAITYMLSAIVFFEDMNSFLQRIVILETRLPKYKAYENCLMDVFTSFLTMCGFAHKYIELGRFKKWITNLLQGEDSELGGARKAMDAKLARLQNATEFAILGNTEELRRMSLELQNNQRSHIAMLEEQMEVMGSIRDTTETIRSDMAKLLKAFDDEKRDRGKDQRAKVSAADQSKPPSAKRIRNVLPEVEGEDHEYHILRETIVSDTCTWVFAEPQWDEWFNQDIETQRLLAITGEPGSGKSHVGATVYERLLKEARRDTSTRTCAAHFYFREQSNSLSSLISAVCTIVNQVVEQSSPICELINTEYLKDDVAINVWEWQDILRKLLVPAFRHNSKNRLFLMLDGIDELESLASFTEFLEIIKQENLRVSIVLTTRPNVLSQISDVMSTLQIEVNKEKQVQDLKALVWNRLNTLDALRKFSRYVKQRIADKVEAESPIGFNALRREGAVLHRLEKPLPSDLHELYESLLEECHRRTGSSRQQLITRLFHWVAFSSRPLLLKEVVSLLRYWAGDAMFDPEEIPEAFAKFVRVGDPGSDAEERAKISSQGGWGTSVHDLDKSQDTMNPEVVYNDGGLPVKFLERSMRSFFREDSKSEGNLRWRASKANRQMFLDCVQLARPAPLGEIRVDDGVRRYTTQNVVYHWRLINLGEHSAEEQAEVMEAFSTLLSNKQDYAIMAEWKGVDYKDTFSENTFEKVSQWAKLLDTEVRQHLSAPVVEWWTGLAENPQNCLFQLARGHGQKLYSAADLKAALTSFRAVRTALELCQMDSMLAKQARKNFKSAFGEYDDKEPLDDAQAVLGLEGVLGDVEMDATAYRAVALLLLNYRHKKPAELTCKKAIKQSELPLDKVKSLELMARIQLRRGQAGKAYKSITSCVENIDHETVPPTVRRSVILTKARTEVELEKYDEAAESYNKSRISDPTNLTAGNVLEEEIDLFSDEDHTKSYMDTLKKWSPLERLTWMAWKYEDLSGDRHAHLRDVAVQTGETDFIIQMYEEGIRYLDNVNAAAPLRCDLASLYFEVLGDLDQTRKVLDEVLDSGSTGWPYAVTDEYPDSTLQRAIDMQTDVLFRLFSQSSDPAVKTELLEAVKGLLTRPLALDVPPESDTYLCQRRIIMSRMYLKMGPATEFQSTLQGVIETCLNGLSDSVGWNDAYHLVFLATALTILSEAIQNSEKLARMARILVSAQFSQLDPTLKGDDGSSSESESGSEDGEEEDWANSGSSSCGSGVSDDEDNTGSSSGSSSEDDEEPPTDEGDLDSPWNVERSCDGNCDPVTTFSWWGGRVAYQCVICNEGYLCEPCYESRQADNKGEQSLKGRQYCGRDHKYIKAPIEGWRGVKDGNVMLEGEEPVEFKEMLKQIRDELCKEAWEVFWRG